MTRILALILGILCLIHISPAQSSNIDSLRTAYSQSTARIPAIRSLLRLSSALDGVNADSSLKYAVLAQDKLKSNDSVQLRYDVASSLSGAYYDKRKLKGMLSEAKKALALARVLGDSLLVANCYRLMALSVPAIPKSEAIEYIQQAIDIIDDTTELLKRSEIRNYDYLAYLLKYDDPAKSFSIRQTVLKKAIELNDSTQILTSLNGIGMHYRNTDVDSAISYFKRAGFLAESMEKQDKMAQNAANIATCFQLKDYEDSVVFYGNKAIELGKLSANGTATRQGLKIMLSHYSKRKDFAKAIEYGNEAMELEKTSPSQYGSMLMLDFGAIYQQKGENQEAKNWFNKALERGKKDRYPPAVATAYAYLGELALDEKDYHAAEQNLREADAMYARMNIEAARVRSFQRLGEVYFATSRYSESRAQYDQLLSTAKKLEDLSAQASAYLGLARCDSVSGNHRLAYRNMHLHSQLLDSFNQKNYGEEVAKLETSLEAEKREAENVGLIQKNNIQRLELKASNARSLFFIVLSSLFAITALVIAWLFVRLRQNKQQIETQASELKALNKTKDRLFGIIAHDLRGPVSGFQALGKIFSHHLKKGNTEKLLSISERVEKQSLQLKSQLDNLLQWSLQQQGSYQPQWENVGLASLGAEVFAMYEESSKAKGNSLHLNIPETMTASVDKNGLRVVLNNLVHNAIKFTEQGDIHLNAREKGDQLCIEVTDSGMGISPARLEALRSAENIASQKGTAGESGTGLGLSLVYELVKRWGGKVNIESELDKGTEIKLYLPLEPA